ncbi:MAG: SRPBCC family protein [Terriglobia bacterium]
MTHFSMTVDIQASPDRVWSVVRDIERWPEWTSTVASVQRTDAGPLAVGSRARILQPTLLPAEWQITELDEGIRSFTWVTRSPGVQVTGRHRVEENGDGSRVTLSLEFSGFLGPLVARFYRSLNQRYIATEAEGLRKRCEAQLV